MAERSVTVRLLALTGQYDASMRASGQATRDLGTQAQLSGTQVVNMNQALTDSGNAAALSTPKFKALGASVAAFGPALIPIGAAATGAAGALSLMGAAGAFAFAGIEAEMAAGTDLGKTFTGQLALLEGNLTALKHAAAQGMLEPFQRAVTQIQAQMPFLTATTSAFAGILGRTGDNLLAGAIGDLRVVMPLLTQVADDAEKVSALFASWSASGGLQRFVNYAQSVLPQVELVLGEVATALAHLTAGLEPVGGAALGSLGALAKAINALPVGTLQVLVPLLVDGYLAMQAYKGITAATTAVTAFGSRLTATYRASGTASASMAADAALVEASVEKEAAASALAAEQQRVSLGGISAMYTDTTAASARYQAALDAEVVATERAAAAREAAAVAGEAATATAFGPMGLAIAGVSVALGAGLFAWQEWGHATSEALEEGKKAADDFYASLTKGEDLTTLPGLDAVIAGLRQRVGDIDTVKSQLQTSMLDQGNLLPPMDNSAAYNGLALTSAQLSDLQDKLKQTEVLQSNYIGNSAALAAQFHTTAAAIDDEATAWGVDLTAGIGDATAAFVAAKTTHDAQAAQLALLGARYRATADQVSAFASSSNVALDGTLASTQAFEALGDKAALADRPLTAITADVSAMRSALSSTTDRVNALSDAMTQMSAMAGGDVIRAQDALQQQLNQLAQTLHDGKGAFDQYTAAGLSSREAVDQSATSAANYAAQVYKQTGSVADAVAAYGRWYDALQQTAQAQGVTKGELDAYLASVGQLPSQVDAALTLMTTVGKNASVNLINGAIDGVNSNASKFAQIGAAAGAGMGFGFATSLFAAVGKAFTAIGQIPAAAIASGIPLKLSAGSTSGLLKAGGLGGGTAQTTLDKITAQDDLLHAQALAAIDPTNKLALAQEAVTDATRRLNNETTKGTTAYYDDLTKLHQAQSDLSAEIASETANRTKALSDLSTAQKQLATDTLAGQKALTSDAASYQALLTSEAASTSKFYADLASAAATHAANDKKLLDQRQADIEGFASADQQALAQWGSSLTWLSANVADQTDQIVQWMNLLAQARSRGVSDDVISALGLDQGPQALGQLKQFSTATQAQIDALNKAVAAKNAAAGREVTTEAANNYGALGQALVSEQQAYADSVTQLQQQFTSDMASLASQADQALQQILDDRAKMQQTITADQQAVTAAQYGQVGVAGAMSYVTPGTALYTQNADGTFTHIPNVPTLQALPPSTPIYDKLFDAGGILPPGRTVAYNATGKNEHVYTDEQLAALGGGEIVIHSTLTLDGKVIDQQVQRINAAKRQAILVAGSR